MHISVFRRTRLFSVLKTVLSKKTVPFNSIIEVMQKEKLCRKQWHSRTDKRYIEGELRIVEEDVIQTLLYP